MEPPPAATKAAATAPTKPAATKTAAAAPTKPAAKPATAPAAKPAAARASTRPGFAVQVAAFDEAAPARALAAKLRGQGFDARVDTDGPWQKVRVGFFATRAAAAAQAKRLDAQGVKGFVTGVGGR
jgi:cell division septation protein DedD